jgi:putative ABC transport system permease protein
MHAFRILWDQRLRFVLTMTGIALCIVLMLFLIAVYQGVAEGSIEYVRASRADFWVLQQNTTNILRSTSFLPISCGSVLETIPGIESFSPILFILVSVETPRGPASLYLTGYVPESGSGGPPRIVRGRPVRNDREIVLDRAFAAKWGLAIGDPMPIQNDTLRVVGIGQGTNMFVIQYAFVTLARAQRVAGLPFIVSCYQVEVRRPATDLPALGQRIRDRLPKTAVYNRDEFLENNIREMKSGFLPLLFVVAAIGAVVLSAILSLILSVHVLEQRQDFAVMKALGSPGGTIPWLVVQQALIFAGAGTLAAVVLYFPLVAAIQNIAPEVSTRTSAAQFAGVILGSAAISLVSSILPNRRLRTVYPMEVFR